MARVAAEHVLAIRPSTVDPAPFIAGATLLVDRYLAASGLSEPELFEIERWWSAHLMECADPGVTAKTLGSTSVSLRQPDLGMGLEGTFYGQQVLLFDSSGLLSTAGSAGRAFVYVD